MFSEDDKPLRCREKRQGRRAKVRASLERTARLLLSCPMQTFSSLQSKLTLMLQRSRNGSGNSIFSYSGPIFKQFLFCSSGFIEDNPDGKLTKVKMMDMYSAVLSAKKATIFVEQIFNKFDTDHNGTIDFKVRPS